MWSSIRTCICCAPMWHISQRSCQCAEARSVVVYGYSSLGLAPKNLARKRRLHFNCEHCSGECVLQRAFCANQFSTAQGLTQQLRYFSCNSGAHFSVFLRVSNTCISLAGIRDGPMECLLSPRLSWALFCAMCVVRRRLPVQNQWRKVRRNKRAQPRQIRA